MFVAKRTEDAVPAPRWGRPGTHRHMDHAPMDVASDWATAPATSAQYPHPAQPRRIESATETARAKMSLADTTVKSMARLRRARCKTDVLVIAIVTDMPA